MQPGDIQRPAESAKELAAPLSSDTNRPRILVIDDELGPRESIRLSLEDMYECLAVDDGFKGLDAIDTFDPDMVILDINMPKIDGIETLHRVREKGSDAEVMLLTAYGSLDTAQKAIRHGVFEYLEKPFDLHELRATVARGLQRRRKRVQVETRCDDLEKLLSRLKGDLSNFDRLARIGQLSAGIVHEMKNPLTVILGYTQMLMGRLQQERTAEGLALTEESSRFLSIIEQETMRCTQIARQLLSYSRIQNDDVQRTTLYELVTNIQTLVQPQCSVNDVTLTAEPPQEPLLLDLNIGQMHDVLLNLCMNALEAMEGAGTLTITGRVLHTGTPELTEIAESEREFIEKAGTERFAVIEVSDSGPGIEPDVLPRLFEPFFTTKAAGSGTGLGLAMSKERIEAHGGMVSVARTGSDGTTFRILLPAT